MDLRSFLSVLESNGKLQKVGTEVDKDWELSCIARHVAGMPAAQRYGLLFENTKGFDIPVAVGLFASRDLYAMALGVRGIGEVRQLWLDALAKPIPPVVVATGPCKEEIERGNEVNLLKFPVPVWTPGLDPAPYLTAGCIVMKDPETGNRLGSPREVKNRNAGMRTM